MSGVDPTGRDVSPTAGDAEALHVRQHRPRKWWQDHLRLQAWGTIALAVIGAASAIIVLSQVAQMVRQNNLLSRSIAVNFQPTGVFLSPARVDSFPVARCETAGRGETCLGLTFTLRNLGPGVMQYIGSLSYWSTERDDFRQRVLHRDFGHVRFDGIHTDERGCLLLSFSEQNVPADRCDYPIYAEWQNIALGSKGDLFLHTLALYSDRERNLYDTLHIMHLKDPRVFRTRDNGSYDFKFALVSESDFFHTYTKADRSQLIGALAARQHPLNDFLRVWF
jgi:hypothetical protein